MATLLYGRSAQCELALGDYTFLAAERQDNLPRGDIAQAVRQALAHPQDYPPLAAATVPGDRVAVMIGANLPHAAAIVRGAVAALLDAGADPSLVTIVLAEDFGEQATLEREFAGNGSAGVQFERHDPDNEKGLAMVGVTRAGEPLRFNRTMAEADFVLPIGLGRLPPGNDVPAKFAGLFPEFSNRETAARLRLESSSRSAKERRRSLRQIDEAGWLAGVGMTVSIVQGGGGGVAAVVAGEPDVVARQATERSRAIWEPPAQRLGDLVIAAVGGDQREPTWEDVARAVSAAGAVLAPGGAIALCTELAEPPRGSLNRLKNAIDFGAVQEKLALEDAVESHPAKVLAQALESGPVYLRSRLPADVVESLGMTPIESDAELSRLAAGRVHTVVIEEAQRILPRLIQEVEP